MTPFNWNIQFHRGYHLDDWKDIYSSCYYHYQIGSINLTHYHIFPWLSAWYVCYIIFCHLMYTFRENRDFVFIITVQFMMCSNSRIRFWLADRIRLFVDNNISLSSLCKLIWRRWTDKMPVRYIWSSVWVSLSIFSQLSMYNEEAGLAPHILEAGNSRVNFWLISYFFPFPNLCNNTVIMLCQYVGRGHHNCCWKVISFSVNIKYASFQCCPWQHSGQHLRPDCKK